MTAPQYPLAQVLEVKQKRVEEAEKIVQEKQLALEREKEVLAQREADRDKVKKHRNDKLSQMRQELDGGTTSPKIDVMKKYLDVVKEKLKAEEKKVKDQQGKVEVAEKALEVAKEEVRQRRKEVDKLETHRREWTKETKKEMAHQEALEQDELGSIIFLSQFHQKQQ